MRYLIYLFTGFVLLANSCIPVEFDCENNPYYAHFFCYVYDKNTKESIVGQCKYCKYSNELSSLQNEQGDTITSERTIDTDGAMKFYLLEDKTDSLNTIINKNFYLHLVDFDGIERDIDTIRFKMEIAKSNSCNKFEYKTFECYYNDSLYLTKYPWNISGSRVIFYK